MLALFKTHFSLAAAEAEASADGRIHERTLEVFVRRETINSWLAQFVFATAAVAGWVLDAPLVVAVGIIHVLVDQLVRQNLARFSRSLNRGAIDRPMLRRIERLFYGVGFAWAMAAWPLASSLDGLRLLLTVVSVAGLLVMANTTCFAPRVFRASVIGYGAGIAVMLPFETTMPAFVLAGATGAFLLVVMAVGAGTARQLIDMFEMQVERDEAIEGQRRTIEALDIARRAATELAETDNLTGLANRFLCMRRLDELIARGERFSLTLLDVDLFKNINDTLGHNVGDEVLKAVARVLASFERRNCFAARLGGDEFALITQGPRGQASGGELVGAIREKIDGIRRADLDVPPISITAGSAYFPKDATTRSDLLAAADMAQREGKKARRGSHFDFSLTLSNTFRRETQIAHAISDAISSRSLFLSFQPKINLESGRMEGAEALSRFSAEGLQGYPLDEIFEVAEKRGLGAVLDELVLDRYREALVSLRDDFSLVLPTSVNLSGAILKAPDRLMAKLHSLVAAELSPGLIRVEITENAVFGRGGIGVVDLLDRIVKLGFSLALDDFGTGSGTLRHLVTLPISEIKIDKSFVSAMLLDRKSDALIQGMVVTGQEMGFAVVAEGVETEEEADRLRAMGARLAQGYLWSRPVPLAAFVDFVRLFQPGETETGTKRPRRRLLAGSGR
jgi:diguanylate cyclase (GGDEF)-like protein